MSTMKPGKPVPPAGFPTQQSKSYAKQAKLKNTVAAPPKKAKKK